MPVTTTAKRALRNSRIKTIVNIRRKKTLKRAVDGFRSAPESLKLSQAVSQIDRAVKNKLVSKNKASRIKSRLSKLISSTPKSSPSRKSAKS